jgi:hypothetical protein
MGKIFRTGCFSKGVCKEYMELFRILARLKKLVSLLEQEKEKLQSIYSLQIPVLGNGISDETHTEIWAIHSEIAPVTTEKWQNLIHPDDLKQSI